MLSPKRYLEDFLHTHLEAYVETFEESSLDIGVLVGDVNLSNVQLKVQEWEISPGLWVELAYGSISLVRLQVPWMELRTGGIKGSIENCRLVFRLRSSEYDDEALTHECLYYAEKMNRLDKEERKFLYSSNDSWVSRTVENISSKFLSQLATGFSLHAADVQCSLLLPGNDFDEEVLEQNHVHVFTLFETLDIGKLRPDSLGTANPANVFFTKEVSIRGLGMRVGYHGGENHGSRAEFEALFQQSESMHMFVNPLNITAEFKGEKSETTVGPTKEGEDIEGELQSITMASVSIKASNFEATPKVEQLQLLKTAADHILAVQSKTLYRSKFWELHPIFAANRMTLECQVPAQPNHPKLTAKELWKFAVSAVVKLRREVACKNSVPIVDSSNPGHLDDTPKKNYGIIYCKIIMRKLLRLGLVAQTDTSNDLTEAEKIKLDEIHRIFTLDELLSFRANVHRTLCNNGVSLENLQKVLLPPAEFRQLRLDEALSQDGSQTQPQRDVGQNSINPGKIVWDFKMQISRFAVAILSPATEVGLRDDGHNRAFSILFYGLKFEKATTLIDDSIKLTIGSVRAYGLDSEEIFLCGGDPHCWLEETEDAENGSQQVSLSLIYKTFDSSRSSLPSAPIEEGEKVCLSKLAVAAIQINWHQGSMNFLRNFFDTISFSAGIPSVEDYTLIKKSRVVKPRDSNQQSNFLSQRWNLKASLEGLQFSILNFENRFQPAPDQPSAFATENLYAIIRVGRLSARGGDYTQLWLEDSHVAGESADQEEGLRTTVRAIQDPNIHTFVYNVDCIEVLLVNDLTSVHESDVKITRIPWSLSGALSFSKHPGDERYPDTRIDILCSRLDLILSVGSTITLIGCANQVAETLFSMDVENGILRKSKKSRVAVAISRRQRLKGLVSLCKFYLNVRFSASNIALTSDVANVDQLMFSYDILKSFADKIVQRGELSQVMETKRRLLVVQLQKLGIKEREVIQIIDTLVRSIREGEFLDSAVQAAVDKISELTQNQNGVRLRHSPIIEVHIGKSKLVLNQLTYDHKITVDLKKLLVTGPSQVPLFQIHRVGNVTEKVNTKMKKRDSHRLGTKKAGTGTKEDADENEKASISFAVEYIETDAGFNFGLGDSHILDTFVKDDVPILKRDGRFKIKTESINLLFQTDIIPLLGKMIHASDRINSYLEVLRMNRRKSTETFATRLERKASISNIETISSEAPAVLRSKSSFPAAQQQADPNANSSKSSADAQSAAVLTFLIVHIVLDIRSIDVVLSHEDNLLALLTLNKGQLKATIDTQFMNGNIISNFATLRLFDLSEVGSLHPTIIWPKSDVAHPTFDFTVELECDQSKRLVLTMDINLTGLRVCVLYRFVQELIAFVSLVQKLHSDLMVNLEKGRSLANSSNAPDEKEVGVPEEQENNEDESEDSASETSSEDSDASSFSSSSFGSNADVRTPFRSGVTGKQSSSDGIDVQAAVHAPDQVHNGIGHEPNTTPVNQLIWWKVHLKDFVVVCPRNSSSSDLLGLTVGLGTVGNMVAKETWEAPTSLEVKDPVDRKIPLHFNPVTNLWMRKSDHEEGFSMSSFDFPLVSEPSSSMGTDSMYPDSSQYQSAYMSFGSNATARFETPDSGERSTSETDTFKNKRPPLYEDIANSVPRISIQLEHVSAFVSLGGRLVNYEHSGEIIVDTEKVKDFNEVHDGRSVYFIKHKKIEAVGESQGAHGFQYWRKVSSNPFNLLVVIDFLPENQSRILLSDTADLTSLSLNLTMAELCLLESVWFDNIFEAPLFFTRRARSSSSERLDADVENSDRKMSVEKSETHSRLSNDTTASSDSTRQSSPDSSRQSETSYGTKEYFKALRQRQIIGEFVLVRADVKIECFIDLDYFVKEIPSQKFLRSKEVLEMLEKELKDGGLRSGLQSSIKFNETCKTYALPIARVVIEGLVLHNRALNNNTSELALGAGLLEVFDTRVPKQGVYDKILRIGTLDHSPGEESKRAYGYADFDYGLKMNPSDVATNGDIPLKVTVINTDFWTTTNVGADGFELNLKNLELVFLVVDFFACYFQHPEFGHPFVAAYQRLPEHKIPYRGVDTRVFATRPQICIMENPLAPNSATLVLESDAGVFYRQVIDNKLSNRIEVKVLDVALIAHQRFSGHDRGLRGSAGSGTGIRTLIEFLDCDYSQQYIASTNHMDVQFCLLENAATSSDTAKTEEPPISDSAGENPAAPLPSLSAEKQGEFVDFEAERLTLKPVEIYNPKCNNKCSDDLKKSFPERSCHIVTSYEDILFSVNLITSFINGKPEASPEEDDKATSKKNKRRGLGKEKEKKQKEPVQKLEKPREIKSNPISIFATLSVYGVRIIVVDNVLGLHLPLLQIFLMELKLTFDQSVTGIADLPAPVRRRSRSNAAELLTPRTTVASDGMTSDGGGDEGDSANLKVYGKIRAWSDYFNNLKKCWEPLLEKVIANALYEKSVHYGQGLTLRSEGDIHINISGAFFRTLNDLVRMYKSADASYGSTKSSSSVDSNPIKTIVEEPLVSNRMERKLPPVQWCPVLQEGARFGFALENSTGQPIRFIQQKDGGKNTISFIDDGERGALNFVATTTRIRNDIIVRDAFNVQQDHGHINDESRAAKSRTKKSLCLQISGYKAIPSVEADGLGVKYEELIPIDMDRRNKKEHLMRVTSDKIQNALKLVAEVVSMNRGRLLHLRSVFTVKNNTSHSIEIKASMEREAVGFKAGFPDVLYTVESGHNLYVPLALLQRSARESGGKALGTLKIRPSNLKPVEDELGTEREDIQMGMDIDYSGDVIDLHSTVETNDWFRSAADNERSIGGTGEIVTDLSKMQLCCMINPKLKKKAGLMDFKSFAASLQSSNANVQSHSNKLPLFCYNIEIQRIGELKETTQRTAKLGVLQAALRGRLFQSKEDRADSKIFNPVHYNIIIHPPIVLESMLPWHGHFEILHANTNRLLWSSLIEPGKAKPIHTVTLDEPLRLRIHLKYCRTGNPVLVHTPVEEDAGRTFVGRINDIQKTVEGFLVETDGTGEDASVELADSLGQRLRLNIENVEGGGGERHIVVYCPYWIVNTSQYKLRLREEGSPKDQLTAGTVTVTKDGTVKDGTRPVAYGSVKQWPEEMGRDTIFPGKIPPLHQSHRESGQIQNDDDLRNMLLDLPFDEIVKFAYMYNYPDSHSLGKRRVCIQIDESEWSQGFSLDSVGTPIPLSIEHSEKGLLEIGYKIKVAPGRLGKYTKIVRFMPRFVIMNRLEMDFKIVQPTGFVGELLPAEVKAKHFIPYHLPAVFGDRSLAVELEGPWMRTVFFDIEAIGTSTLRVMHKLDLGAVDHVNTRGLPHYEVTLRPEDDIGIWFETDWEEKNIVVKSFRHGSFAHEETDIQIGDVIIGYNLYDLDPLSPLYDKELDQFEVVSGRDFEKVMKLMKERETPMRLMIRTVEENIRLLRKADQQAAELINKNAANKGSEEFPSEIALRLEVRQVEATTFIVIDAVDNDLQSEYMLENYSVSHIIHYKQKGVTGNNWCSLAPGQSISYIWEDPFKPHKLLIKAGRNILSPKSSSQLDSDFFPGDILNRTQGILEFIAGVAADDVTVISLDEIGTKDREVALPNGAEGKLYASVNIKNGSTKTLAISHDRSTQPQLMLELAYCAEFLKMQHESLSSLHSKCLVALKEKDRIQKRTGQDIGLFYMPLLAQALEDLKRKQEDLKFELREVLRKKDLSDIVLSSYLPFETLWGQRIERKHQVVVEILEAKDLRQFVIGKLEDTYCSVQLRIGRRFFQRQTQPKYTNVSEQNMNPVWIGQKFVFDVPDFDDISTKIKARDVKIRVNVMSKTLIRPIHRFLGQADIQFSCLKSSDEEEVKGYFLLRPEAPSVTAAKMVDVSGSIKMCLQWIHSDEGLLKSNINAISNRLSELEELGRVQHKLYQYADAANMARSDNILSIFQNERGKGMNMQSIASGTLSIAGGIAGGTLSLAGGIAGATLRMPGELVRGLIRKSVAEVDIMKEIQEFVPSKPALLLPENVESKDVLDNDDSNAVKNKVKRGLTVVHSRVRAFTKLKHHTSIPAAQHDGDVHSGTDPNHMHLRGRRSTHYEKLETLVSPTDELSSRSTLTKKHRIVSKVFERRAETIKDSDAFAKRFEEECRAAYTLVHTQKGRLVVTPLAAHNLPGKHTRKVMVRFTYGDLVKTTISKPNSADLSWSSEDLNMDAPISPQAESDDAKKDDKKSLQKVFDIETLNIKSSLLVQVMEEGLRKRKEIARLEIPIFNLLDCLCRTPLKGGKDRYSDRSAIKVDENVYEMWFAMVPTDDLILGEGDTDLVQRIESEQQDYMGFSKGSDYKPCIQLRFKFTQREGDEGKEKPGDRLSSFYFRLQVPSLSVSIVDSTNAREVMQCSVRGIECRHAISKKFINSSLNVMWLQVDNQLPDPISAIILAPTQTKNPEPTIRINIRKDNELSRDGLTSYDFIVVKVETLDLSLEQQTVVASWALIKNWFQEQASSSSSTGEATEKGLRRDATFHAVEQRGFATCNEFTAYDLYDLLPTLVSSKSDTAVKRSESKLYISFINITDVRINVSFIMNPKLQQSAQKVEKLQQASWSDDIDLLSSITFFLSQVGVVALDLTSSISDAPITFAEFQREKIFETDTEVEKRLRQHYLYSALTQLYKIVGSLELVGNPVGLVTSLGIGVTDFFYEPYHALITNPTDIGKLGRGLAKGALSVVSNTTEGFIGTGTTVTRSLGRIGARFAMDPAYVVRREELQRQPRTPAEAIYRPFRDIGNGVYYGVVGLVKVPYNNYRRHRALGILPGIAKGIGGLLAKSVVGVVDAITHTGDAARELVRAVTRDLNAPVRRLRLRNQFGPDGRLLPYSYTAALGMHAAQALDRARLESMGNAINESVGFVTSMGRMLSLNNGENQSSSWVRARRPFIPGPDSPRGRSRSNSTIGFDINDLSSDSYDETKIHGIEGAEGTSNNGKLEFVIHTFMKKITRSTENKANTYQLVIVTTARVLVSDYTKKKRGASQFVRRWEADMRYLKFPKLEKRKAGGYLLTLSSTKVADTETLTALVKGPMIKLRKSGSKGLEVSTREGTSSDFSIESTLTEDDGSVLELYNCITIVKNHTDLDIVRLEQTKIQNGVVSYGEDLECEDDGIFKIGPWEYSNSKFDDAESLVASKNAHLTRDLEATGWNLVRVQDGAKEKASTWLEDERRICINAHKEVLLQQSVATLPLLSNEEFLTASEEAGAELRKAPTRYLKDGLQAAQSMLVSSARTIERAVSAVSSVALSPGVALQRNSGTTAKGLVEPATTAAESHGVSGSHSPKGIIITGLSPRNGDKKKGISFDFDVRERLRAGQRSSSPFEASTAESTAEHTQLASPIVSSPNSHSPTGSLRKLFSPFPASSSPNPVTLQHQPSADLKNTIPEAKLDTNGQQTSKAVGASHPLEVHNDSNEFSDAGSMAGTLASQDSEAMAALHGRLDRLESLLLAALRK